MNRKVFA